MGGVTLANALISGYVEYERYETRDKRRSYLVVLHTTSRVDEHYIETIVLRCAGESAQVAASLEKPTVCDRFLGDSCSVFAIPLFVELHAPLAIGSAVDSKHAQVAHVNSELLHSTTPTRNLVEKGERKDDNAYTRRNVSQAAIKTRKPFWMSQKQTLDRLVLLPTPLTPTKTMLYGMRC